MYITRVLLFICLFCVQYAAAKNNHDISHDITLAAAQQSLVGVTWGIITPTGSQVGSAGYANVDQSQPMLPNQKMHVGSVTKSVLALGVMRLISDGRLSLDAQVHTLLPQVNFINPWADRAPITVRHLLDHTAGLDNVRMWQVLSTQPKPDMPLIEAFPTDDSSLLRLRTEPGTQYSYSNMGYALLGMIIEAVTLQSYEDYLDANLLAPLHMYDSTFTFVEQQSDSRLAMGYHENNMPQPAIATYLRPAGQFTTTAPDMVKLMGFMLGDGTLNGKPFIAKYLMTKLATPFDTDARKAGMEIGHGLALALRDRHSRVGQCHPGTTYGFRAYMCIFPKARKGFFIATNTDSETADYEQLNKILIDALQIPKQEAAAANNKGTNGNVTGLYLLSPNNMAEFAFPDRLFHYIWVAQQQEQLVLKSFQGQDRKLIPVDKGLFRQTDRSQASHVFYTNAQGDLLLNDGRKTYKRASLTAVLFYWLSLASGLASLLYILIVGITRMFKRDSHAFSTVKWAFFNLVAFALPCLLYVNQSFLAFGDVTAASICLAILTGLLPISQVVCLYRSIQSYQKSRAAKRDMFFIALALQMSLVLFYWGWLPTTFWR
ncbi:serine hydrolase domain-containing protein [Pseudoalteromonas sp. SSDWG2]|uniref:serine hydrolase domain-containing protein n=1 Tax=Pseudoalteromonas sp. SSDWG2 TaxID=3139391 RepID=UPI003BA9854D